MEVLETILRKKDHYSYILLDMAGEVGELSPLYLQYLRDNLNPADIKHLEHPSFKYNKDFCPQLICIKRPNEAMNEELLEASFLQKEEDYLVSDRYLSGWISSKYEPMDVAYELVELGKRIAVQMNTRFVSYYQPFCMTLLNYAVIEKKGWVGGYLEEDLEFYYPNEVEVIEKMSKNDLKLSDKEYERVEALQRERGQLSSLYYSWIEAKQSPAAADDLAKLIKYNERSKALGLRQNKDRNAYILFSMRYGDLSKNKTMRALIGEATRSPDGNLARQIIENKAALMSD